MTKLIKAPLMLMAIVLCVAVMAYIMKLGFMLEDLLRDWLL